MDYRIRQAIEFIDSNLEKKLDLKELAKKFNLSYIYFSQLFKSEIGICFSKYLIKKRIKRAKELLRDDTLSIKEVSYKAGYKYISNFNHDFKKQTGLAPLEYRKIARKLS